MCWTMWKIVSYYAVASEDQFVLIKVINFLLMVVCHFWMIAICQNLLFLGYSIMVH